jgi:hypothetical protein
MLASPLGQGPDGARAQAAWLVMPAAAAERPLNDIGSALLDQGLLRGGRRGLDLLER